MKSMDKNFRRGVNIRHSYELTGCYSCKRCRVTLHTISKPVILCTDCKKKFEDACRIELANGYSMVKVDDEGMISKTGNICLWKEPVMESYGEVVGDEAFTSLMEDIYNEDNVDVEDLRTPTEQVLFDALSDIKINEKEEGINYEL